MSARAGVKPARATAPSEVIELHTRIMKCALEVEDCRAYWARVPAGGSATVRPEQVFDEFWFGARSLPRVVDLLANMRRRFDAYPSALGVLGRWAEMPPEARRLICHWHLQLADMLYRRFTGEFLVARRDRLASEVTRDEVREWVETQSSRWTRASCIKIASNLLSAAHSAGLVTSTRDPRPLAYPRPNDEALTYLLYLLREVRVEGSLLANPYLASVGLSGPELDARLRALPDLGFRRQSELIDFGWAHPSLTAWADARWGAGSPPASSASGAEGARP